jgi:hypothetical protein
MQLGKRAQQRNGAKINCFCCFDENITETKVANSKNVLGSILGEHVGLRDDNLSRDIKKSVSNYQALGK